MITSFVFLFKNIRSLHSFVVRSNIAFKREKFTFIRISFLLCFYIILVQIIMPLAILVKFVRLKPDLKYVGYLSWLNVAEIVEKRHGYSAVFG